MELFEAIKTRRSIRAFSNEPISQEILSELVNAGVWAPSAGNMQAWRFIIITDSNQIEKIKNLSPGIFGKPKAVIAVCSDFDEATKKSGLQGERFAIIDASMAAENILLAAHDKGLGACVIGSFHELALQRLLNLPPNIKPILLIILGFPAETPKPPKRKFEEIIWWEVYK
ncbi:MAG: nitroreductase family protein [Caldiserica bacterium]|nr:nitroreductase family protein [Caldisericota bacterium]